MLSEIRGPAPGVSCVPEMARMEILGDGVVEGSIALEPRGSGGFGWDSVFMPDDGGGRTYGEMEEDEKNLISHRRKAFDALRAQLS